MRGQAYRASNKNSKLTRQKPINNLTITLYFRSISFVFVKVSLPSFCSNTYYHVFYPRENTPKRRV